MQLSPFRATCHGSDLHIGPLGTDSSNKGFGCRKLGVKRRTTVSILMPLLLGKMYCASLRIDGFS